MSKWKCGICNREFENYHVQGFDNIIYCPLCYYKELYKRDKKEIDRLNNIINEFENKGYDIAQERADFLLEIDRLNNIINELEKWLNKKEKLTFNSWNKGIHEVQRKLQELKENNKDV